MFNYAVKTEKPSKRRTQKVHVLVKNIDFPEYTAKNFGIHGVEYVNQFFKDKAKDMTYLKDLNNRAKDNGVKNVLIMIDGEGNLGDRDETKRLAAVENHHKWIDAAHFLGSKGASSL